MNRVTRWSLAALVGAGLLLAGCDRSDPTRLAVTGQIEGVTVDAGTRLGGRVMEVRVDEGTAVEEGDVLVRLEPFEAEAAVAAAKAQVAQAEAFLAKLKAGATEEQIRQAEAAWEQAEQLYQKALAGSRPQEIAAGRASVAAAEAVLNEARATYDRIRALYEEKAVSAQQLDQARSAFQAAEAQYRAAREQAEILVEGAREEDIAQAKAGRDRARAMLDELLVGARPEDIQAAEAAVEAAKADLARAEVALREMTVTSPRSGVVESIRVEPGDLVQPGPVVRIVDPEELELTVYVSAGALGYIRLGDTVKITTDSLGPDRVFEGTVSYIASEGEYTPRNLQTEEERVQQVFGVRIDLQSYGGALKAGMTATAHFDLSDRGEPARADEGPGETE